MKQKHLYVLWIVAIMLAGLEYLLALNLDELVQQGIVGIQEQSFFKKGIFLMILCMMLMFGKYLLNYLTMSREKQCQQILSEEILSTVQHIESFQHVSEMGHWLNLLTGDVEIISNVAVITVTAIISGVASFIVAVIYGMLYAPILMIFTLIMSTLSVILPKYLTQYLVISREKKQEDLDAVQTLLLQLIRNRLVLRVAESVQFGVELFRKTYRSYAQSLYNSQKYQYRLTSMSLGLGLVFDVIVLSFSFYLILIQRLTLGQFMAINVLNQNIMWLFNDMPYLYGELLGAKVSLDRISKIEKETAYIAKKEKSLENSNTVSWSDINYSFDSNKPILQGLNLTINVANNEKIVVSSESGSGKSTLLRILIGELESNGKVFIDNHPIQEDEFISFSYVPQKNVLFSSTLRENIALGNQSAFEDLENHLSKVGASYLLQGLENRLENLLNNAIDQNLSYGQIQKIALARALMKPNAILILDEPLANVDEESELIIAKLLKNISQPMIIVSHRLDMFDEGFTHYKLKDGKLHQIAKK